MAIPFFELENATVYRGERIVFDRINLRLEAGTHTAVLGPNGSGKSTLVKLIFRDIYPAALPGSVMRTFGNELMNAWELRKRIGLVSADLQHRYMASVTGRSVVLSGFYSSIATGERRSSVTKTSMLRIGPLSEAVPCPLPIGDSGRSRPGNSGGCCWPVPWFIIRKSCFWTNRPPVWI